MRILCICLLTMLLGASAQELFPPFSGDLSFYHGFEDSAVADLTLGSEKSILTLGKLRFEAGLHGKALFCGAGGAKLRFQRAGNLNFDSPGTIVFFYKPIEWEGDVEKKFPRLFFWAIESNKGYIGLQGANDPKNICMCQRDFHLMLLFGARLPSKTYVFPRPGEAGCKGWHMLACSWAGEQFFVKWDKLPAKAVSNGMAVQESDFPANSFSLGNNTHWRYLMDDFMIYKRRLTDDELNQLYDQALSLGK